MAIGSAGIDQFKFNLINGVSRPNRYTVDIIPPLSVADSNTIRKVQMLCEGVQLPGCNIATSEDKFWGPVRKMVYLNTYQDVFMTFICSQSMVERKFFEKWQSIIANKSDDYIRYYDDYVGEITISTTNEKPELNKTHRITLKECYPIEIMPQELSYSENDSYLKFQVNIAYRRWEDADVLEQTSSGGGVHIMKPPGVSEQEWQQIQTELGKQNKK